MQVKKFEAPTLQEALDTVKRELGPEAIILQTKKYKRGFGLMSKPSVEVTAAISERSLHKKGFVEARLPAQSREQLNKLSADRQVDFYDKYAESKIRKSPQSAASADTGTKTKITATRYIDIDEDQIPAPQIQRSSAPRSPSVGAVTAGRHSVATQTGMSVEEEIRHLKRMIEEMKNTQDETTFGTGAEAMVVQSRMSTPALQSAFEQLVINGVEKRYAFDLVKRVSFELGEMGEEHTRNPEAVVDVLATEIMRNIEVSAPLSGLSPQTGNGPQIVALVGPTGVGKTTTVAKIASEAILKKNLKVGLINLDSYKVAAFDQLGTYARILNVPFRSAGNREDLQAAIQDFHTLDLILIDTTGRSQKDPGSLGEMQKLLQSVPGIRTEIVLSVTTRDTELYDMTNRFAIFNPEGIIISKLDEGSIYGAIFNISQKAKLPLVYFTTGQRVPEDIEDATRERLAALILDL
jgi:flagellar biosynthesis protein FlhF